ncbi:MAG: ParA family protein [Acidobacteria bacterium]|nr:ParA family protein [Acidobacteriota bacterium]
MADSSAIPELPPPKPDVSTSARIIAVTNQKGGVGKTTTAINLAAAWAMAGRRVLLVDIDPQANATSGLGLKGQTAPAGTIYEALTADRTDSESADRYVLPTTIDGLSLMAANRHLAGAELELIALPERERRLAGLLADLRPHYDFILIDCPPSLGLLTLNALVAAHSVLIPLHCEYFALEGLADLVATLRRIRGGLNPGLDIEGVLLTMNDDRTNLGQQVAGDVRAFFKDKVYNTVIPRNVRLAEAPSHGVPAVAYDARSRGAEAYLALAREVLDRNRSTTMGSSRYGETPSTGEGPRRADS